jgi:ribosomal protein L11 methyltransferase
MEFTRVRACRSGRAWPATPVGARLLIQPAFERLPPGDRLVVRLLPLFGFGTTHQTTLLTLEALEARLQAGEVIADIGCGTAVLSIAAMKMGAARVHAVDADAATVETARANREFNRMRPEALRVEQGSIEQLVAFAEAPFDGILCNTSPAILEELIPRLGAIARTGTWAVASGFRGQDEGRVEALFEVHGWRVAGRRQDEAWRAVDALRR